MKARDNPFRTERLEALPYRFLDGGWEELLARLGAQRFRGALVGPKGSGKTTLLEALARHLGQRGLRVTFIRLSASKDARRVPWQALGTPGPGDALLVDGAEQLAGVSWLRLRARARRAGAFVVTTHRPGRLRPLLHTRTSPALLAELVDTLLPPSQTRPGPAALASLHAHCRGNVREALLRLYDEWSLRGR